MRQSWREATLYLLITADHGREVFRAGHDDRDGMLTLHQRFQCPQDQVAIGTEQVLSLVDPDHADLQFGQAIAKIPAALTYNAIQNHIRHRIEDQVERFLQSEEWRPSITAEGETHPLDTYATDEAVSSTQNYAKAFERLLYVRITIDKLTAIAVIGAALYLLLRA